MTDKKTFAFENRDLSWLSFNERVLQEASDPEVPLIERIRFLGIYSSNRDEYFKVRVATLKRMNSLSKRHKSLMDDDPEQTLIEIQKIIEKQQKMFDKTFQKLLKLLNKSDIHLINEKELTEDQHQFATDYFKKMVRPALVPVLLETKHKFPYLLDEVIYLAVKLYGVKGKQDRTALIELPTDHVSRFLVLPQVGKKKFIMLLEDIIRVGLDNIFSIFEYNKIEAYTIKLTRDAELDMEDDLSESFIDKVSKSVKGRKEGAPVRFIYDQEMPKDLFSFISKKLGLQQNEYIIAGGRYHNFRDFIGFPDVGGKIHRHTALPPMGHPDLKDAKSLLSVIAKKDVLLAYPFHSFDAIVDILREAAIDPNVKSIKINIYRVASNSKVINALLNAVKNGKKVTAVMELTARFDEEANIHWSNKLQEGGVHVIAGVPGLKVHSKLILISRKQDRKIVNYAHVGTGNFHEKTALIYSDMSLLTANPKITAEVERVFDYIENPYRAKRFNHLIVSPVNTRRKFIALINKEIKNASAGKEGYILLKLNNLVDKEMIKKLYEASAAGVKIELIVRGVCSLVPGVKGISENITAISIVDRFLEHSRIIVFGNDRDPKYFIASADWMTRNLDHRIEVCTPIYDKNLQKILRDTLQFQLDDNTKSRILDKDQKNKHKETTSTKKVQSQLATYKYFQDLANLESKK